MFNFDKEEGKQIAGLVKTSLSDLSLIEKQILAEFDRLAESIKGADDKVYISLFLTTKNEITGLVQYKKNEVSTSKALSKDEIFNLLVPSLNTIAILAPEGSIDVEGVKKELYRFMLQAFFDPKKLTLNEDLILLYDPTHEQPFFWGAEGEMKPKLITEVFPVKNLMLFFIKSMTEEKKEQPIENPLEIHKPKTKAQMQEQETEVKTETETHTVEEILPPHVD